MNTYRLKTCAISALLGGLCVLVLSCDDDTAEVVPTGAGARYVVLNEGGFNQSNASLTTIDPVTGQVNQAAYSTANEGALLGDVLQSAVLRNEELYLVVNNSSRVVVTDASSLKLKRSIEGLDSPRYLLWINSQRAFVSDLAAGGIHVIDPSAGTVTGFISTGGWTEHMLVVDERLWVSNPLSDEVLLIDMDQLSVSDTLQLRQGASGLVQDASGAVWVMCQGTFSEPLVAPALYKLNSEGELLDSLPFAGGTGYGGSIALAPDGEGIYCLVANNLYAINSNAQELPQEPLVAGGTHTWYGLSVLASRGEIALTDAVDYSQAGRVYVYDTTGTLKSSYAAGQIPSQVLWVEP